MICLTNGLLLETICYISHLIPNLTAETLNTDRLVQEPEGVKDKGLPIAVFQLAFSRRPPHYRTHPGSAMSAHDYFIHSFGSVRL